MEEGLIGLIERITFRNMKNGHTVARMRVSEVVMPMMIPPREIPRKIHIKAEDMNDMDEMVTIVGKMASVCPGEELAVSGEWVQHEKFGAEFRVKDFQPIPPTTVDGIQKYLGSGLVKGIGPVLAQRIVAKFGLETLAVIENDVARLLEVEGIGHTRVAMIRKGWQEHKDIRELLIFLRCVVSVSVALKIHNHYGRDALKIVKESPYRLATEVRGIGFATADVIAHWNFMPWDSPERIRAGVIYILQKFGEEGHTYCPYDALMGRCGRVLKVKQALLEQAVDMLLADGQIVVEHVERRADEYR